MIEFHFSVFFSHDNKVTIWLLPTFIKAGGLDGNEKNKIGEEMTPLLEGGGGVGLKSGALIEDKLGSVEGGGGRWVALLCCCIAHVRQRLLAAHRRRTTTQQRIHMEREKQREVSPHYDGLSSLGLQTKVLDSLKPK